MERADQNKRLISSCERITNGYVLNADDKGVRVQKIDVVYFLGNAVDEAYADVRDIALCLH